MARCRRDGSVRICDGSSRIRCSQAMCPIKEYAPAAVKTERPMADHCNLRLVSDPEALLSRSLVTVVASSYRTPSKPIQRPRETMPIHSMRDTRPATFPGKGAALDSLQRLEPRP